MKRRGAIKILLSVPIFQPDPRFLDSFPKFLNELKQKEQHYKVEVLQVGNSEKFPNLVSKQNYIAEYFLNHDFDYLLFVESDNWGFTLNMLKALLRANTDVCGQHYISRWFPYYSCCMVELPDRPPTSRFGLHKDQTGYQYCDIVGYGMTLIKREVFNKLEQPYFRLNKYNGPDGYATDIDFCDRLKKAGLKIMGCFDYFLNHRDITQDTDLVAMRIKFLQDNKITMEERYSRNVAKMLKEKGLLNGSIPSSR
jgi:hypothetical protein